MKVARTVLTERVRWIIPLLDSTSIAAKFVMVDVSLITITAVLNPVGFSSQFQNLQHHKNRVGFGVV
jgi:hypothetical protein